MKRFIQLLLLISPLLSVGQQELSLAEAKRKALETNRQAQKGRLEVEKAKRVVKETLAIGLPQVNAEGSFQNFLDIPTQVLPDFISPTVYGVLINENLLPAGSGGQPGFVPAQFGTEYTMSGGVTLSQLIFNGSYLIGLQAAKSYVQLSEISIESTELEVKEAVSQAYFTAVLAAENTRVLSESEVTLQKTFEEIQALYEEGFVEEQDAEQIQMTLNTLRSQVNNSRRQELLTKQLLNYQIGQPLNTQLILSDDLPSLLSEDAATFIDSQSLDLDGHPMVRLSQHNILLSELQLKEQKSRYWPTLNGFFNHSQQAQRNEFNFFDSGEEWFPNTVWGVNLSVPIFSSGMKHNKVKQLEISLKEAELDRDLAREGLELQATQARSDLEFALENLDIETENLDLAKRIRDKTRIKYQEGISSSFELNEAETQFLEAQARKLQASLSMLNAKIAFQKAYNTL